MYLAQLRGVQVDVVTAAPLMEGFTEEDSSTLRAGDDKGTGRIKADGETSGVQ